MALVLCASLSAAQDIAIQASPNSADNSYPQLEAVHRPITPAAEARAEKLRNAVTPAYGFQTSSGHGLFTPSHSLALASGTFRPRPGVEQQIHILAQRQGYAFAWIQPVDGIQSGFLDSLHALGIETYASLSGAVQAKVPAAALQNLATRQDIRWVGTTPPRAKLHPALAAQIAADENHERLPIWVSLMGNSGKNGVQSAMAQRFNRAGLKVLEYRKRTRTFAVDASAKEIMALSALNEVHFLSTRAAFEPHNGKSAAMTGNANIWADYQMGRLINQTPTGVIDSGFTLHTDLAVNRIDFANGTLDATLDPFGHGTQVLGALLGRGSYPDNYDARGGNPFLGGLITGRVWLARYFDDAGNPVGDINDLYAALATAQAGSEIPKVINCSWGTPPIGGTAYTGTEQECLDIDHVAFNTKQLYVFAAGNDGLNGASTVGIPGAAANVLTVGNIKPYEMVQGDNTLGEIALTSSQGPTGDGRLKPELTAPGGGDPGDAGSGSWTTSASGPAAHETAPGGTSMATPQVTALAASLIDRYPDFSFNPPALRAALMAMAMHPGAGPQNDDYGFGMIDAYRAHHDSLAWTGGHIPYISVKQGPGGNLATADIDIPVGTERLTIALSWMEPALSTTGGATPVTGHIDLGVDYGITGWMDASATGNANYQYLVLDNPTPGPARLTFYPRDTDLNDDGTPTDLLAGAAYLFESSLNPTISTETSLSDDVLKKYEWANITTVVSTDQGLASLTIANLLDWSDSLPIQSVQYTLQDGSSRYVPLPDANSSLILGSLIEAQPRSVQWAFSAAEEGEFTVNMKVNSDNGGSVTETYTVWVDSTPPNLVTNLSSPTHPVDVWVTSPLVEMTWDTAIDNLAPNGDNGSGIGGYSTAIRSGSPGDPDQSSNLDGTATSESFTVLSDGIHFFSIATMDRSENWSSAPFSAQYGPIKIDATGPDSSGMNLGVASGQTIRTWYTSNAIDFYWSPATDTTSGLWGYSKDADTSTIELGAGATFHTEYFADGGDIFFGLIPVDNLGNAGDIAGPLGPFWIDTVAPTAVVGVSAPQAEIEQWTNQTEFTFSASEPAIDETSGVAGYDTDDDDVIDNNFSRSFSEGSNHYFTIKAIDHATNVGPNATFGPYWVDTTAPSSAANLSGDRPTSTWTNNPLVTFTWSGANDALSGIGGYDVDGDGVLDIPGSVTSHEHSFPDGDNLEFSVAAVDVAGNLGAATPPVGPFWIDTAAPDAATNLSSDQNANEWTNNPNFLFNWSSANDATSGIAGYDSTGDGGMDIGDVTTTSRTYPDTDGAHFSITPFDIAGNIGSPATIGPFMVDTVVPGSVADLTSSQEPNVWTSDSTFTFGWIPASDDRSGVAGYDTNADGSSDVSGWETSKSIDFPEGAYNMFTISALDHAGNIEGGVTAGPFRVDLSDPNPATNLTADSPTTTWSNNPEVTFHWSPASDALSGIDGYDTTGDGLLNLDSGATSTTVTFADGLANQFGLYAYDLVGNRSALTGPLGNFWIDTTSPSAVTSLSANQSTHTWTNDDSFAFTFNAATDSTSGVAGYDTNADGIIDNDFSRIFPEGTGNDFSIQAIDNAGNIGDIATIGAFWVDVTAPTTPTALTGDRDLETWTNDATISFSWGSATDILSGLGGYESSAGILDAATLDSSLTFADGINHKFELTAYDTAGNRSATQSIGPYWVDATPPQAASGLASDQSVNAWTNNPDFNFTWTEATDAMSGVAGYDSTGDGVMDLGAVSATSRTYADSNGETFSISPFDHAGNMGSPISLGLFMIDTVAPNGVTHFASNQNASEWTNDSNFVFTWTSATDDRSGLAGYDLNSDGILDLDSSVTGHTLSFSEGGEHHFTIAAVDNATNMEAGQSFGPYQVDLTPPSAASNLAADMAVETWSNNPEVTFSWSAATDALSGLNGYDTTGDGSVDTDGSTTSVLKTFAEGVSNQFSLYAYDNAGNRSALTGPLGNFWIDLTAPTVVANLTSDQTAFTWTNNDFFQFSFDDATDALSGVAGYDTNADGLIDGNFTRNFPEGTSNNFSIQTIDNAGNIGNVATIGNYWVDITDPIDATNLSGNQPTETWTNQPTIQFQWNSALDLLSGISHYESSNGDLAADATSTTFDLSDGNAQYFELTAFDRASNSGNAVASGPYWVDTTAPTSVSSLTSNQPADVWTNNPLFTFEWVSASDATSGLIGYDSTGDGVADLDSGAITTAKTLPDSNAATFSIYAIDLAGNAGAAESVGPFMIDTVAPGGVTNFASDQNANEWTKNSSFNFSWAPATDDRSGIGGYDTDNDGIADMNPGATTRAMQFPEGEANTFSIAAIDYATNIEPGQTFGPYLVDQTKPSAASNLAADRAVETWSNNPNITFTWDAATDALSGLNGYDTTGDGAVDMDGALTSAVRTFAEGTSHQFGLFAFDHAGNRSALTGPLGNYWIDLTDPLMDSFASSSHSEMMWSTVNQIDLSWSASDALSGIGEYFLNGASVGSSLSESATLTDGQFTHEIYCIDLAGNQSDTLTFESWVDTIAPTITSFSSTSHAEGVWVNDGSVNLSWSAIDDTSSIHHYELNGVDVGLATSSLLPLADGIQTLTLEATDFAGNVSTTATYEVRIDTILPTMDSLTSSSHIESTWSADGTLTLAWSASDTESGIVEFILNGSSVGFNNYAEVPVNDGESTHSVYAIDAAGNTSDALSFSAWIDTTAPVAATDLASDISPKTWSNSPIVNFTWTAALDAHSGLAGYDLTGGGGLNTGPETTSWERHFQEGDGNLFGLFAHDNLGHISDLTGPLGPFWIDLTAPTAVTNLQPDQAPFVWTNDNTVTFTFDAATDALSGVAGYDTDGDGVIDNNPTATFPDGQSNAFSIQAIDAANNIGPSESLGDFWVDTVQPSGTIFITPSPFSSGADFTLSPNVEVNFTSSDDRSGVTHLKLSNDGITWTFWTPVTEQIASWDMTDAAYGGDSTPNTRHTVYVKFRDAAGNEFITSDDIFYLNAQKR